jgi:hypothetical protein
MMNQVMKVGFIVNKYMDMEVYLYLEDYIRNFLPYAEVSGSAIGLRCEDAEVFTYFLETSDSFKNIFGSIFYSIEGDRVGNFEVAFNTLIEAFDVDEDEMAMYKNSLIYKSINLGSVKCLNFMLDRGLGLPKDVEYPSFQCESGEYFNVEGFIDVIRVILERGAYHFVDYLMMVSKSQDHETPIKYLHVYTEESDDEFNLSQWCDYVNSIHDLRCNCDECTGRVDREYR